MARLEDLASASGGFVSLEDVVNQRTADLRNTRFGKRGCDNCPLNHKKKVLGKVRGNRGVFVWAMCPGKNEEAKGKELVGPAGRLLWHELRRAGIERDDCEVQNVVRCRPTDEEGRNRDPKEKELHCCSLYTDKAIEKSKATVYLVLGEVAAKNLLGKEYKGGKKGTRKDRRAIWSERLHAHVLVTWHPSYFVRGGCTPGHTPVHMLRKMREFRNILRAIKKLRGVKTRFGYAKRCDWQEVRDPEAFTKYVAAAPGRVAVDIEDTKWANGNPRVLCLGVSARPGEARVVFLDHPDRKAKGTRRLELLHAFKEYFGNAKYEKVFHFGHHDVPPIQHIAGCRVRGYTLDTAYSSYFMTPEHRAFGLDSLAQREFPEMHDLKDVVAPYILDRGDGSYDFSKVPWEILLVRNAADVDLTKRLELRTQKHVHLPLLKVYINAAFYIDRMEKPGVCFDYELYEQLQERLPQMIAAQEARASAMVGKHWFNIGSPQSVSAAMYKVLNFPVVDEEKPKGTGKEILEILEKRRDLGKKRKFATYVLEHRRLSKLKSTYLNGYKRSAEAWGGFVRTIFWLTGAITARLRSGGSGVDKAERYINLQNIAGDPVVQNLLCSDTNWRKALKWRRGKPLPSVKVFIAADYSQAELRTLALMAGVKRMLAVFEQDWKLRKVGKKGADIHVEVGHVITGKPKQVIAEDEKERRMVKAINFGLIYGRKAKAIWQQLTGEGIKISLGKIERALKNFFLEYEEVPPFIAQMETQGETKGYVSTLFGFKRPISPYEQYDDSEDRKTHWKNQCINSPIQGTAGQLLIIVMAMAWLFKKRYNALQDPCMEVHDSLVVVSELEDMRETFRQLQDLMQVDIIAYIKKLFGIDWTVPLVSDVKAGFVYGVKIKYTGQSPEDFLEEWQKAYHDQQKKIGEEYGIQST